MPTRPPRDPAARAQRAWQRKLREAVEAKGALEKAEAEAGAKAEAEAAAERQAEEAVARAEAKRVEAEEAERRRFAELSEAVRRTEAEATAAERDALRAALEEEDAGQLYLRAKAAYEQLQAETVDRQPDLRIGASRLTEQVLGIRVPVELWTDLGDLYNVETTILGGLTLRAAISYQHRELALYAWGTNLGPWELHSVADLWPVIHENPGIVPVPVEPAPDAEAPTAPDADSQEAAA